MEFEGKRPLLGWNVKFGKKGHTRLERIPIDNSAYARSKDGYVLAHDSQYENPLFVPEFLKGKNQKGWTWDRTKDLDGDGELDTVIYNENHQPMFWNGFHYVDKYPMVEREKFMMNPDNKKYDFMMSKYKYDIKSNYEKVLTDVSIMCHEHIKDLTRNLDSKSRKQVLSELSSQFFKSFVKEAFLIPTYINQYQICSIEAYKNELLEVANGFDNDKKYKMGKHRELMKVFRLMNDELSDPAKTPNEKLLSLKDSLIRSITGEMLNNLFSNYAQNNGFVKGGDKIRLIVRYINMLK